MGKGDEQNLQGDQDYYVEARNVLNNFEAAHPLKRYLKMLKP